MGNRIPLTEEPIDGRDPVAEYDRGAKRYMTQEYRHFVRKVRRKGIRSGRVLDITVGSAAISCSSIGVSNRQPKGVELNVNAGTKLTMS